MENIDRLKNELIALITQFDYPAITQRITSLDEIPKPIRYWGKWLI